jgi:chemotaxis protein methyltransferase CheR
MQEKRFSHIRFASSLAAADPGAVQSEHRENRRSKLPAQRPAGRLHELDSGAKDFLDWLFHQGGVDRRFYRDPPLYRRLGACLRILRVNSLQEARKLLDSNPCLQVTALDSILIGVSEFFRDAPVFYRLATEVIPGLLRSSGNFRVWSSGCSDGAELYSIAFILGKLGALHRAELVGTDCRANAVERAGTAFYDAPSVRNLLPEWGAWLTPERGGYSIAREIRKRVRFEQQDVFSELPAGEFDLVLCRNLAIYLRTHAALTLWQRAASVLSPGGFLVTGKAERAVEESLMKVGPSMYRKKRGDTRDED